MPSPASDEADQIVELATRRLVDFIANPDEAARVVADARCKLADRVVSSLETLVQKPDSYRDALLVALATPLVRGERVDITERQPGGRAASDQIGKVLRGLHIKGVKGAFQNIGKNTPRLARGNNPVFDEVLAWGSEHETLDELDLAFAFVAASIAATAKSVLPRPRLRLTQLTFANVMYVLDAMLEEASGGAHEQYICAAALEAFATLDVGDLQVRTKALSASDRSSTTAGDIEILRRGRLQEGIEVSANLWRDKLSQAEDALRAYGLGRAHIVARSDDPDLYGELRRATQRDISVIDPLALVSVLVALLDRSGREQLLLRLYELLDEKLASPVLVNQLVNRLVIAGLSEP